MSWNKEIVGIEEGEELGRVLKEWKKEKKTHSILEETVVQNSVVIEGPNSGNGALPGRLRVGTRVVSGPAWRVLLQREALQDGTPTR